jgi:hypothetical protein
MNAKQIHLERARLILCATVGACETILSPLAAQTWQPAADFQALPGLTSRSLAIGTDSSKILLYSAGWATIDSSGTQAGVVRASADSGRTWTVLDLWYPTNVWPVTEYQSFCAAPPSPALPKGALFTSGDMASDLANTGTIDWIVRRSVDGGATWTLQDVLDTGVGGKDQCRAIHVAPSGAIYAAGIAGTNQAAAGFAWVVRRSSDGGTTWTTVDSVWSNNTISEATAIGTTPSGGIFVVGRVADVWSVRRSTDGGASWTTVDSYEQSGMFSEAYGVAVDGTGTLYVAGVAQASSQNSYSDQWVVRRSTDGGSTWTTLDNYTLESYSIPQRPVAWPTGITLAPSGSVFVCGFQVTSNGSLLWLVREGTPGTKDAISWATSDDYQNAVRLLCSRQWHHL